uniref:GLOBIN domain-containing protein n=1 Tax=Loa loa TaxID=7209 RepID=A0A1I7VKJ4_LOALO
MNALKKIIESLKNEQIPYEVLQRISVKHARHNIQTHHIQKMIKPLVENVRRALGRQDENAERAWETLFQTIAIIIEHCKKSLT